LRLTTALYYTPSGRSIQGKGISPDIVVEAPKDEQVAGELPREATLNGAFHNPGPLGGESEKDDEQTGTGGKNADSATPKADLSAPIKPQLIATPKDAQLNAALAYLEKKVGGTTAAQNGGANRKAN
jgi:carboxyl-terminal processing protease